MHSLLNKTTPISPMRGSISAQSNTGAHPSSSKLKERPSIGSNGSNKNAIGIAPSGNYGFQL